MQNTEKRPSVPEEINDIEKYINLYVQKYITRLEFLNAVCYYYKKL